MPPHEADWKYLAEEASNEMDPEKLLQLVAQLNRVLGEREESLRQRTIKRQNQDQEIKPFRAIA